MAIFIDKFLGLVLRLRMGIGWMIACRKTLRCRTTEMRQCSKAASKNVKGNKHLARNSLLVNSTTISSNLELCRWICKKDRCTITHHFSQNLPVFTNQHTGWHTLPPGKALFAAGLTPALPQRRLMRQQLDDPATQEQIFYRHWR
jgi:hypothetical protein